MNPVDQQTITKALISQIQMLYILVCFIFLMQLLCHKR